MVRRAERAGIMCTRFVNNSHVPKVCDMHAVSLTSGWSTRESEMRMWRRLWKQSKLAFLATLVTARAFGSVKIARR